MAFEADFSFSKVLNSYLLLKRKPSFFFFHLTNDFGVHIFTKPILLSQKSHLNPLVMNLLRYLVVSHSSLELKKAPQKSLLCSFTKQHGSQVMERSACEIYML